MRRLLSLCFAGLASLALAPAAPASGFIVVDSEAIGPRRIRLREPRYPLRLKSHSIDVKITGSIAVTTVEQVFHNNSGSRLQGTYMFPAPADAAITKFSMFVTGKDGKEQELHGEVLESNKARGIYEGIVRRMQDPALLEYMGRGLFKVRVFPIEPHSDKRLKLTYSQSLEPDNGRVAYRCPLKADNVHGAPLEQVSVTLSIDSKTAVKSVFSPSHPSLAVTRKGDFHAEAALKQSSTLPAKDFDLYFDLSQKDVGLSIWTYKKPTKNGYFLLNITPKIALTDKEIAEKDIVFVVDTSGSMRGPKMEQLRKALAYCIRGLNPRDRFNVVPFSLEARPFYERLVPASEELRAAAVADVLDTENFRASGGTNIHEALIKALSYKTADAGRPFTIVFMTDGLPSVGLRDPEQIKEKVLAAAAGTRIFTLGIGDDVNPKLLDAIAEGTRADREYVLDNENLEVKISNFYDKLAYPVLSNVELFFEGLWVKDVYPKKLPDLFKGRSLQVVGRYLGKGAVKIRLRGQVNNQPVEYILDGEVGAESARHDFIPGRWAQQKIGELLDIIRLQGDSKELRDEVIYLAKKFGLPTPYTSYLIVEDDARPEPTLAGGRPGRGSRGRPEQGRAPGAPAARPAEKPSAADEAMDSLGKLLREQSKKESGAKGGEDNLRLRAIRESLEAKKMRDGKANKLDELDQQAVRKILRRIGAKTFYKSAGRWVDSAVKDPAKTELSVELMSSEYFELAAKHPELARYLALEGEIILEFDGKVYRFFAKKTAEGNK